MYCKELTPLMVVKHTHFSIVLVLCCSEQMIESVLVLWLRTIKQRQDRIVLQLECLFQQYGMELCRWTAGIRELCHHQYVSISDWITGSEVLDYINTRL